MYKVSTLYLDLSAGKASEDLSRKEFESVEDRELLDYLEKFVQIRLSSDASFTPILQVTSTSGVFRIERSNGMLLVSNTSDPNLINIEASPDEAFKIVTGVDSAPSVELSERRAESSFTRAYLVPIVVLAVLLGIGAAIGNRVMRKEEPLFPKVDTPEIIDSVRISELEEEFTGVFVTGRSTGDRIIALSQNGRVEFLEFVDSLSDGKPAGVMNARRSYTFAEKRDRLFAVADGIHVINLLQAGEIEYYEDRYERFPGSIDALLGEE